MENIEEKKQMYRKLKEQKKQFVKDINDENAREWNKIVSDNIAVYVYHSRADVTDSWIYSGKKLSKVTVVGLVNQDEDGTYSLTIAWSRCAANDNYNHKIGNIIAAKRAQDKTPFRICSANVGGTEIRPMVLKGFATPYLKDNFMPIAAAIVDRDECLVDAKGQEFYGKFELADVLKNV